MTPVNRGKGLWVTPDDFVSFGEAKSLSAEIATRSRSIDYLGLSNSLPNPDPVLKRLGRDIKVYRELRSDAHVGGCIRRRKAAVKAMEWGLDRGQAKSRVAKSIEDIFADLPIDRIIGEMLDAALYGYQPLEIMWGKVGRYLVPVDVIAKPADWFQFDPANQLRFRVRGSTEGELLPPRKFLVAAQDATYDNPYGFPDLSMVFWPTTFKKGGLKFWVTFTEKYGSAFVIGKQPRGTTSAETEKFADQLEAMIQDAVAVIPDDSSVEIKEAAGKAASSEVYERLLHFCRSEVSIALLGQNQTTEASANKASATAGLEVTREIRDGDAALIAEPLNQLIRWICDLNFDGADRPSFSLWEQEEVDQVQAQRDKTLVEAGARLTPAYFMRAYSLQDGDLVMTDPPAEAPADPAFAEGRDEPHDQVALDQAMRALDQEGFGDAEAALLAPLVELVKGGAAPDELLGALAGTYPDMDATGLQRQLARALFVADLWGRLSAAREAGR